MECPGYSQLWHYNGPTEHSISMYLFINEMKLPSAYLKMVWWLLHCHELSCVCVCVSYFSLARCRVINLECQSTWAWSHMPLFQYYCYITYNIDMARASSHNFSPTSAHTHGFPIASLSLPVFMCRCWSADSDSAAWWEDRCDAGL